MVGVPGHSGRHSERTTAPCGRRRGASTLWHPHIVGVHDRGEEDGQLWISTDFVDRLDAARLLTDRYPTGMPIDLVARIVTAVASALDYAHKQGLLHRDVKPANIMMTISMTTVSSESSTDFGCP